MDSAFWHGVTLKNFIFESVNIDSTAGKRSIVYWNEFTRAFSSDISKTNSDLKKYYLLLCSNFNPQVWLEPASLSPSLHLLSRDWEHFETGCTWSFYGSVVVMEQKQRKNLHFRYRKLSQNQFWMDRCPRKGRRRKTQTTPKGVMNKWLQQAWRLRYQTARQ